VISPRAIHPSQGTPEGVENNGSVTRVGTFPIGIHPERFTRSMETDDVQSHIAKLLNRYAGRKVGGRWMLHKGGEARKWSSSVLKFD